MEVLRWVADLSGADPADLVAESASAMRAMAHDPAVLVLVARRLVDHHPTCGPLWTMCARAMTSADPATILADSARAAVHDGAEARADALIEEREDARPAVLVAQACAVGDDGSLAIVEPKGLRRAARARTEGRDTWLVVPAGACVPRPMWDEMLRRATGAEVLAVADVDLVVRTSGEWPAAAWRAEPECPPCPGLLAGGAR
jgi:hypothetical protein